MSLSTSAAESVSNRAIEHHAEIADAFDGTRESDVPERAMTRDQDGPVRFGDRVPGDAVALVDGKLLHDLVDMLVEPTHHLDDDEVLLQRRMMFVDPAAQAEARAASRAALDDPDAPARLPGLVAGRRQAGAGVASRRPVLLQERIAGARRSVRRVGTRSSSSRSSFRSRPAPRARPGPARASASRACRWSRPRATRSAGSTRTGR